MNTGSVNVALFEMATIRGGSETRGDRRQDDGDREEGEGLNETAGNTLRVRRRSINRSIRPPWVTAVARADHG